MKEIEPAKVKKVVKKKERVSVPVKIKKTKIEKRQVFQLFLIVLYHNNNIPFIYLSVYTHRKNLLNSADSSI